MDLPWNLDASFQLTTREQEQNINAADVTGIKTNRSRKGTDISPTTRFLLEPFCSLYATADMSAPDTPPKAYEIDFNPRSILKEHIAELAKLQPGEMLASFTQVGEKLDNFAVLQDAPRLRRNWAEINDVCFLRS